MFLSKRKRTDIAYFANFRRKLFNLKMLFDIQFTIPLAT